MKRMNITKRMTAMLLCFALLLSCAPLLTLRASAADTGGISTYLSDFGFAGKTISILGDSISTFENYSNGTAASTTNSTITNNKVYYYESTVSTYGVDVNDTWWRQTADVLGMDVLVNNAWSGSRVYLTAASTVGAYVDRCQQLHDDTGSNSGQTPDIIAVYLGTNDMKNSEDPGDISALDYDALKSVSSSYTPSSTFEAYALMLQRMIKKYPKAEIYCMTLIPYENITTAQTTTMLEFNAGVKAIAQHYGVYVVDLYADSGLTAQSECFDYHMANRLHPGPYGMDAITNCLVNAMLENSQYSTASQTLCPITYDLDGVYVKRGTIQNALQDKPLTLSLGTRDGFAMDVTVTMGGVDITDRCYDDGVVTIDQVTGDIQITAKSVLQRQDPEIFRWELTSNHMLSVNDDGAVYNGATLIAGSCASSVFTDAQYSLEKPVILFHDRPWVIQWKSVGAFTGGMLMLSGTQNGKAAGNTYIFRKPNSSLVAIGYSDGSAYYNYGLDLSDHSIDGTVSHTYRLVNQLNDDGSNMVYLYVDNKKLGAMNNYYYGGTDKNTTSDWINGKDLLFTQMGTDSHPINDGTINYIQIWENGVPEETEPNNYRWESQNGSFTSLTTGSFTRNNAEQLSGSITTAGKFTGSYFEPEKPIVLLHDRPWSVEWRSSGTWKDATNGAMLLSASDTNNALNGAYLYRRGASEIIAFGERADGAHQNYGIRLADHGIDGSAEHTYRLTNRVNADGTNMVYLYVDGAELGAMNNYYVGGTAQGTTSDWVSGRDFTFCYMGTPQFPIGNCYLQYLQVWEGGLLPNNYRWEMTDDTLTSVTTDDFTQNDLTALSGSISSGKLSGSRFQLDETVILRHERPWSMEWQSSGSWKDTANGALLFSTSDTSTTAGTVYLYRRSASNFIAFGTRSGGKHLNYGVSLSDHGIDGSASHVYRLTNRLNADGSNMVYLYVDGVELGAMNNYYVGGTAQGTTSDWVSGQDFVFTYMGTTDFPIGNCYINYLQIWEEEADPNSYRWETQNDVLTSITTEGFTENTASLQTGSISSGTYTGSYFALDKTAVLLHDKPWSIEWESEGNWNNSSSGALLFSADPVSSTEGNVFLYRRKSSTLLGLGTYTGGKYYNYGVTLSDYGIDGTARHVYRLTNRLHADGSNMVYLYVDDVEIGPMNGYYLGGTAQGTTSDWLSGKDLTFSYFGTQGHTINSCAISYIQIWEDGVTGGNYRWETQSDVLVDVTGADFTENEATMLSGTITDGLYAGVQYSLQKSVALRHDSPWAIRWQSQGNWKDAQQGAMLFSSHPQKGTDGVEYLYRRSSSDFIAFGVLEGSTYKNYGIKLSTYGIDGTAEHEYLLANRVNADGSNMVYLFVDGQEVGPLNNYFKGGNDTFTKSDWISGRDFTFSYLGTDSFFIGGCYLDYLQVWEEGAPASTVTFQNDDGTVLSSGTYLYGQKVTLPQDTPTKATDETASYTFSGWIPEVTACGGDAVYTAAYTPTYIDYTVEFRDHDGTVLASAAYHYGDTVTAPADPVRPADETYTYTFSGWDAEVGVCTGNAVYTAVYTPVYIDYTVQFVDEDGTVLSEASYHYGDTPTVPTDPTKEATAQYTYRFGGWSPAVEAVTADAVYTASYTSEVNSYAVTFLNEDGTVLSQTEVLYGEIPTAPADPTKEATAQYTYHFSGWSPAIEAVTGEAVYTAAYTSTVNSYTVTFQDEDGTVLSEQQVPYGAVPTAPADPAKAADVQYTYRFAGWYPAVAGVTGPANYSATYTATAHSYDAVLTTPTCTASGFTTYTCSQCGYSYIADETAATGHSYEAVVTAPTCTEPGYTTYTCHCGDSYVSDKTAATGHSYEATVTAPTCTEPGYTTYTCPCGDSYTADEVAPTGHSYGTVTVDATCTENGTITDTCTVCGDTQVETIPATGHSYEAETTTPTCTEAGYTTYTCPCGDTYTTDEVAANGHSYQTVTVDATCTENGTITDTCTVCGDTQVETIPATGHSYEAVITAPACTEAGYTTYTCHCGDSYTADEVAATGHSYADGICTVCGEADPDYVAVPTITLKYPTLSFEDTILLNVYFDADQFDSVEDMGLITYSSEVTEWNVDNAEEVISGYGYSESAGLYYATTNGIPAKCLGDTLWFAVYAKLSDGSYIYTKLVSYSPRTYAYTQLNYANEKTKALVVAMLNYGAAAQTYFSYNTDALVNDALTADHMSLIESYRADMMDAVPAVTSGKEGAFANTGGYAKRYPTISFEGAFCINYYYTPSYAPVDGITMYYWNQADFNAADVLTAENATGAIKMAGEGTGEYLAVVEGIAAKDLDKGIYVSFCYSDGTTSYASGVLAYSIGSYCTTQASYETALQPFAKATAVYGYYAKQLFYEAA